LTATYVHQFAEYWLATLVISLDRS